MPRNARRGPEGRAEICLLSSLFIYILLYINIYTRIEENR